MDVTRPVLNGLLQHEHDEPHDGRLVGQVLGHLFVVNGHGSFAGNVLVRAEFLEDLREIGAAIVLPSIKPVNLL